jgi:hypothetical protein
MAWKFLSEHLDEEVASFSAPSSLEEQALDLKLTFSRSSPTKKRDNDRARYKPRTRKKLPEEERKRRRRESEKRWVQRNREHVRARARVYRKKWNRENKAKLTEYHRRMWADPAKRAKKKAANLAQQKVRRAGKKKLST